MSSRMRLFRWITAAAAVLIAVAVGVVAYQMLQGRQGTGNLRQDAEAAQQTLTAAVETANGLVLELSRLFESEVTAPPARAKAILDRARALQQQVAVNQSQRAPQALAAATAAANDLMADLARLFENEVMAPGERVRDILTRTRGVQQQLTTAGLSTPELQRGEAAALMSTVDVLLRIADTAGAFAAADRAREILEALLATDPGNTAWQRDLVLGYEKTGNTLVVSGQREQALAAYQKGLEIGQKVAEDNPGDRDWQSQLVVSSDRIGNLLGLAGKRDEALAVYQNGLAIRQKLADSAPGNAAWQRDIALSHERIGNVLAASNRYEEALAAYQKVLAISQKLAEADPGNAEKQRAFIAGHDDLGNVLAASGKRDEAIESYRKGLAIMQKLADGEPANGPLQRDLGTSYDRIGFVMAAVGRRNDALGAYRRALTIRQKLAESDPRIAEWQDDLQFSIARIGGFAYRLVQAKDYTKALEVADQAIALAPRMTWLYTNRAHALMFLGRVDQARALYLQFRGEKKAQEDKSWVALVTEDFAEFRKAKLTHPLMDEIEKRFASGG
jgi:tetratricopeptide (TPR) repeat protein